MSLIAYYLLTTSTTDKHPQYNFHNPKYVYLWSAAVFKVFFPESGQRSVEIRTAVKMHF